MATRTPARTVRKSLGKSFKNTLDLPYKFKWPPIAQETASQILTELVRSLGGVKVATTKKKKRTKNESSATMDTTEEGIAVDVTKRHCLDTREPASLPDLPLTLPVDNVDNSRTQSLAEAATKRSQFVVGLKEVTKALERGNLRAVVVCRSSKPTLLHEHLQILAATRCTPCIGLYGVSDAIAPILGLKSAMTIGLKTIPKTTSSRDYFSTLATLIVEQAPAIHIPWLHATARQLRPTTTKHLEMESETERGGEREELLLKPHSQPQPDNVVARSQYFPVSIKKTIITPKKGTK